MWYRVNDPLSPLSGCDVRGRLVSIDMVDDLQVWTNVLIVEAVRRVDVFMGDRPYQRVAETGGSLGIMIDVGQLIESPIQDDVIELATSTPYGKCVEERDHDRSDGLRLRVVEYELMAQVALDDTASKFVLASATVRLESLPNIEEAFCEGNGLDEMQFMIANEAA